MEKSVRDTLISEAASWAAELWREALSRWVSREGQDRNYRTHVIHPALFALLRERIITPGVLNILEVGCGDGTLLDDEAMKEVITQSGRYVGLDISQRLLTSAKSKHARPGIDYFQCDLTGSLTPEQFPVNKDFFDCALSVFTLQEVPDISAALKNIAALLNHGGFGIFFAVHPAFGEWLAGEGHIGKNSGLEPPAGVKNGLWQWAGCYPIVDEPGEPFYLPYFHRSIDEYGEFFREAGFTVIETVGIPEKEQDIPRLVKAGVSPFAPFDKNLYWPCIGHEPSAAAFIVSGKEDR